MGGKSSIHVPNCPVQTVATAGQPDPNLPPHIISRGVPRSGAPIEPRTVIRFASDRLVLSTTDPVTELSTLCAYDLKSGRCEALQKIAEIPNRDRNRAFIECGSCALPISGTDRQRLVIADSRTAWEVDSGEDEPPQPLPLFLYAIEFEQSKSADTKSSDSKASATATTTATATTRTGSSGSAALQPIPLIAHYVPESLNPVVPKQPTKHRSESPPFWGLISNHSGSLLYMCESGSSRVYQLHVSSGVVTSVSDPADTAKAEAALQLRRTAHEFSKKGGKIASRLEEAMAFQMCWDVTSGAAYRSNQPITAKDSPVDQSGEPPKSRPSHINRPAETVLLIPRRYSIDRFWLPLSVEDELIRYDLDAIWTAGGIGIPKPVQRVVAEYLASERFGQFETTQLQPQLGVRSVVMTPNGLVIGLASAFSCVYIFSPDDGRASVLAGDSLNAGAADLQSTDGRKSRFSTPDSFVLVNSENAIYCADTGNNALRKITLPLEWFEPFQPRATPY